MVTSLRVLASVKAWAIQRHPSAFNGIGRRKGCVRYALAQYTGW